MSSSKVFEEINHHFCRGLKESVNEHNQTDVKNIFADIKKSKKRIYNKKK
jgi:hypothetical protein